MNSKFKCFHGHKLRFDGDVVERLQCPLCGSIYEVPKSESQRISEPIAPTMVPVSLVDPSASPPTPLESADSQDESSLVAPTSEFDPSAIRARETRDDHQEHTLERLPDAQTERGQTRRPFEAPRLEGYEVMDELGRGGMGVVYQAYDEKHRRDVALKTLQRMSPDDLVRFKQEFRALADIAHPNLASLYELLSDGKTWCFTMEMLDGVEFLDYVWSGFDSQDTTSQKRFAAELVDDQPRLSMRRLNRLYDAFKQLAVGLHALHRADKLHSDIKPSNVVVTTEQRVVLLDFGLIAEINRGEDGRVPRVIQGTPHYMSPEQAACAPLSEASDWYAVGVMLYEILTGRLPIRDKSVRIMLRKQYERPVEPAQRSPGVPPELNELCMALLEIDPRNRPNAADVLRAVDAEDLARTLEAAPPSIADRKIDLVGRDSQMATLERALAEVQSGETRSVFVHGLSGMGKSALVRSFLDAIKSRPDVVVLEGRCYEQESVPFKALDSLIDALVVSLSALPDDHVRTLMPEDCLPLARLFPVLGQIPGTAESVHAIESADQQELRQRALDGLRELLRRLGRERTVVLHIDDLQWGDEDSSNLIADLVRPPDSPSLLLLGAYRREDAKVSSSLMALDEAYRRGPQPAQCDLPIEPLTQDEAQELALMLLGRSDSSAQRSTARIADESRGSPFFVWELAQHLSDDSTVSEQPLELDEVIWSRVCRLPAETRHLLEVFAVAGRPMRASVAFQAIDATAHGPSLLAQLRTSSFVRSTEQEDDTTVETYHDRIRESVVNHLAATKVRGHHLRLALAIEQASDVRVGEVNSHLAKTKSFEEPSEPFAIDKRQWQQVFDLAHFFHAADKPDRALPFALAAAEQAWSQNALEVAEQQYGIARLGAENSDDATRFRVAEGLGDVLVMRGKYDAANRQFQTARSLASESPTLARIDGKRGYLCFKKGEMGDSAKHFELALTEMGNPPPKSGFLQTTAVIKEGLAQALHSMLPGWFVGRRSSQTKAGQDDLFRARLYDGLGYAYWFTQGPVRTLWTHLRHMNLAERYATSSELGRAYAMHAIVATSIPLAARGVRYAERSYQIHGEFGDRLGQGKARSFQTFSLLTLGRFQEGAETGREAVRMLEQAGDVWEANMSRIILSQPLYFLGRLEDSHFVAKRAFEIGQETGDHSAMAIALYFWVPSAPQALPLGALQAECERPREDPLSTSAALQGRGLELLLREDDPAAAALKLQESLDAAKSRGFRNPAIFCGATWRVTALRLVAERETGEPQRRALREAKQAAAGALKLTKKYRTCRPRALREWALIAMMEQRPNVARNYFKDSLQLAEQQDAAYELALTQLACSIAGRQCGWPEADEAQAAQQAIDEMEAFRSGVEA